MINIANKRYYILTNGTVCSTFLQMAHYAQEQPCKIGKMNLNNFWIQLH